MATCTQCGAELKPGAKFCENCGAKYPHRSPLHSPQLCPSPSSADPGCTAAPQPQASGGNPMQAAHLPPRSPGRTQRILTQAMRPAHRRRPAQAHRFTPETHPACIHTA